MDLLNSHYPFLKDKRLTLNWKDQKLFINQKAKTKIINKCIQIKSSLFSSSLFHGEIYDQAKLMEVLFLHQLTPCFKSKF